MPTQAAHAVRILLSIAALAAPGALAERPGIAAGVSHTLAVDASGIALAWGNDGAGQLGTGRATQLADPVRVRGLPAISTAEGALAGGWQHALAVAADGSVWAWGSNDDGQLGDGTTTDRTAPVRIAGLAGVAAVAAGARHSLALGADGSVWSWGANDRGQLGDGSSVARATPARVAGLAGARAVAAGASHSLVLLADGSVWAWGDNHFGQLGDGTTMRRGVPARVGALPPIVRIAAGATHNLAIANDGRVWAWGNNREGQVGDGTLQNRVAPVRLALSAARVAATGPLGGEASYALSAEGTLWRWGFGASPTPAPAPGSSGMREIVAGANFWLAMRGDGMVVSAGANTSGQLGRGASAAPEPGPVTGVGRAAGIAAGHASAFAVTAAGELYAWGDNSAGQLGAAQSLNRTTPGAVTALTAVRQVAAGDFSLALREDGSVWLWGPVVYGTTGASGGGSTATPVAVVGLSGVRAIAAGAAHGVALRTDGTVWTWGFNNFGQLGRDTPAENFPPRGEPGAVPGLANVVKVAAGDRHSVAVLADGSVWTWGGNADGQLGVATAERCLASPLGDSVPCATRPVRVPGIAGAVDVAASAKHTLALLGDGSVRAWGNNLRGALGDGTSAPRTAPVQVAGLPRVTAIAAGGEACAPTCGTAHSLALAADGTVWAWGDNSRGQLGGGSADFRALARPVANVGATRAIAAGAFHAVALRIDGSVIAWGGNRDGAVGDGSAADRPTPAVVVREGGSGTFEGNDWFLDLDPAAAAEVAVDKAFALVVEGSIAADALANVSAQVRFRAADQGRQGNVYVFALAPADRVINAAADPRVTLKATGSGKSEPVQCVLAQLSAGGQLVGVSADSLQAFVSGVLSSQGQAVTILNGVPAANVSGATFFVGYGTSGGSMVAGGTNRGAASAPGEVRCQPQPPQTGWWWNPAEGGRGYSIEQRGNNIFFAAFHYDVSGRATWHVATGPTSLDGSLYTGELLAASGGQTLTGPYPGFPRLSSAGTVTLAFNDASRGTMIWPGGTVPIERFDIVPGGLAAAPREGQPESGWWWNPAESGRGFFIEWQNGWADVAGYMYDERGDPVWYLSVYATPDMRTFSGSWWSYANGQTMGGAYKPATRVNDNVGPVTIRFQSATEAILTLPGGNTIPLTRHRF